MIAICVFLAATLSGATGLGFPLLAAPIFLLYYDPPQAILITCICSLIGQSFAVVILRQTIHYEVRWHLIVSGVLGVPVGTVLLLLTGTGILRFGFALLLIASSLWLLIGSASAFHRAIRLPEMLVGVSGGICGGLFGVSSALPAAWLSACGYDKTRQRAIIQPYIIAMQCISLVLLCLHHALTAPVLQATALCLFPLLTGIVTGAAGFRLVSNGTYSRAVLTITLLSGVALLVH